jgi:hypothetical protein
MFVLGFFLMSLAPVGYQYAAEITFPAPEGTSNGLINLAGQASVVFIIIVDGKLAVKFKKIECFIQCSPIPVYC